jgi:O-antigen ligase
MSEYNQNWGHRVNYEYRDAYDAALHVLRPASPRPDFAQPAVPGWWPPLQNVLLIGLALLAGGGVALLSNLPVTTLAFVLVMLCGGLGALAWASARWPVVSILRVLLLASLALRAEINLFPQFKYNEGLPGLNISLLLLTSVALLVAHGLERLRGKAAATVFPVSFSLLTGALLLWCLLGVANSRETLLGFYAWWSLAGCLLFTWVVANEFGHRARLRTAVCVIALMIGLNGLIGVCQATMSSFPDLSSLGAAKAENLQAFGDGEIKRASGLQGMANSCAWFLVTLLPVLLAVLILRAREFSRRQNWLLAGAAASGLLALLLTYARGSWIAFALAFGLLLLLGYRSLPMAQRQRFARQIAILVLFGLALCLPFFGPIIIRLTEDDNGSAYSRVPLSQVAQTMIMANPLLGVGLSNYEAEMRRYDHTTDRISEDFPWPVHNIVLHTTAEAGLPALLLFLALTGIACRQGWLALRCRDPLVQALAIGLLCGVLAYCVTGLKELGSLGQPQYRPLFLCFGLLLALGRISRQTNQLDEWHADQEPARD